MCVTVFDSLKVLAEGGPQVLRCLLVALGVVVFPQYGLPIFVIGQVNSLTIPPLFDPSHISFPLLPLM